MQIKFTTCSGTNPFTGSGYFFYQSDVLNSNSYANEVRGLPKGPRISDQPGIRQGGPVVIPGLYDGRGKVFFFINYEETRSPGTITTNSTLLLPDAQNGVFRYPGGPPEGVNVLCARGGERPHLDDRIPLWPSSFRTSGTPRASGGVLSEITGNLNTERYTFQQRQRPGPLPDDPLDYSVTSAHRVSGTCIASASPTRATTRPTRGSRTGRASRSTARRARGARRTPARCARR